MIWVEVSFSSLDFIFRREHYVVICFKREKWSLVCLVKRRIRSERISFHELIFIIEILLKGKRWSMKEFIWQSIRAIDVQLIHWCCKSIFWDFLRYRVNKKEIEWFCCIFDSLLYLYDSLSSSNITASPFSKWGISLQIWRSSLSNMFFSSNYDRSLQIWLVALTLKSSTSWLDMCLSRILSAISQYSQWKSWSHIKVKSIFVSEKKKKRINSSYRTWCDWRCLTFFRTYSRKSKF